MCKYSIYAKNPRGPSGKDRYMTHLLTGYAGSQVSVKVRHDPALLDSHSITGAPEHPMATDTRKGRDARIGPNHDCPNFLC